MSAVRGSLDVVTTTGAMGWAYPSGSKAKLTVQALLNHTIIGEAIADIYRADLAAVGLGDGNCGYNIEFYQEIDPLYLPFIVVKLDGGDLDLPRAAVFGYNDYFNALYRQHPVTARYRSVFGGLWTDRIDAASLLKDRLAVGMIAADVGATISGFLQAGLTIVEVASHGGAGVKSPAGAKRNGNAAGVAARGKASDQGDVIRTVLESKSMLELLHPILEGPPLAVSARIMEGTSGFHQASAMEGLQSPAECLTFIVPLDDYSVELDIIRDSHQFPEFSAGGQSRWINPSDAVAIDVALKQSGMVDRYTIQPGSVAIVGPGLIHRVRTEPGTSALRVHCTPSRVAPLDRMLDGERKEIALKSGARIWIR